MPFSLKIVVKSFIVPPGLIVLLLLCLGSWVFWYRRWKVGYAIISIAVIAWLLSISPISDAMLAPLESDFNIPDNPEGDVIILLGAGVSTQMPDFSGIGAPSQQMLYRMMTAVRLQKRLKIPLILSGRGNRFNEAASGVLSRFCLDMGVSNGQIIIEDKSNNTIENAKYTSQLCRKNGFSKPILVTSAYHMKRATWCFEKQGFPVIPFPAGFETWKGKTYHWISYLPGDFSKTAIALNEYFGLVMYRLMHNNE